ncbi:Stk1 family PASTA domain-containing Ser/Thr kinase [Microbacterium sp. MPKO10]|uniref:Stk1 family PASTA domain-containing Ser/Thr kinase n=1 Tax=Microbacterium sp. MPKO10 TaxID=2989818 RepID=UPI002235A6EF|nr:Stk1 family PASTA domain-containing Ser/Thr kinase [Microbacterium sp. MPKO10]MCW4459392.1 Stk1 family PASTA domain-containing Ser/Thr kinase [Microbacterium sp. MPKO10]
MTTSQQTDPLIGRVFDGRYEVRSRIARGGMATVYVATDHRLERRVAIKVMHGHLSDDQAFTNRFVQEARSAARLANPHVVSVFDQGQDGDMAYLVMEYLPGITLRELLRDHGALTPQQVVDIMDAVLTGLASAHRAGIVHRDVKPENVLLADDGRIKISDFGLARAASANTATGQALLGTIAYLSPELVTRGMADTRSDIYALGIMMYEMLTGEQPYKGEQPMQIAYQHANDSVPRPSTRAPNIPDEVDDMVLWATERDPDERPADAQEMLDRLHEVEAELGYSLSAMPTAHTTVMPMDETVAFGSTVAFDAHTAPAATTGTTDPLGSMIASTGTVKKLTTTVGRRRRKGLWMFLIVVLLCAVVGGTGWYFGTGPGSRVAVPDTFVGDSPDAAAAALEELGLVVKTGEEYSLDVEEGLVTSTNPAGGELVYPNSTVTVNVSLGPKPEKLPSLAAVSFDEAQKTVEDLGLIVGDKSYQFNADVAENGVIAASIDGDDVTGGVETYQGKTVDFLVSVGPVPKFVGQTQDAATAALDDAGLTLGSVSEQFSDSVPKGTVISADYDTPLAPGDTVDLVVSKGQDLVQVPDVVGMTINAAKQKLEEADFVVKVDSNIPKEYWDAVINDLFAVDSTDPAAGEMIKRGSTVTITANL